MSKLSSIEGSELLARTEDGVCEDPSNKINISL